MWPLFPTCDAFGVGRLVQVEHGAHLVDLTVAVTDDAAVVADHEVAEVHVEGFAVWQHEGPAQQQQAVWPQVGQSKSLRHDIFQPPVGPLFLVGFRQIQVVLPDILRRGGRKQPLRRSQSHKPVFVR